MLADAEQRLAVLSFSVREREPGMVHGDGPSNLVLLKGHTREGGRDDRGVPFHVESTPSSAQVLKVTG